MNSALVIVAGSVAGGLSRYYVAGWAQRLFGPTFPYGTLLVNLTGCFLIGFFSALSEERFSLGPGGRLLLMTGFCGAYTTFSTFMLETGNLIKDGELTRAMANIFLSLLLGFLLFRIGVAAGEIV